MKKTAFWLPNAARSFILTMWPSGPEQTVSFWPPTSNNGRLRGEHALALATTILLPALSNSTS